MGRAHRVPFLSSSILAVALLVAAAPLVARAADPCALCNDRKVVTCPTCAGKKTTFDPCPGCDGKSKRPCFLCAGFLNVPESEWKKLAPGKGLLPCPNTVCVDGTVTWELGEKAQCKLCAGKGAIDCKLCSASEISCYRCNGKMKVEVACTDCRMKGEIPCPLCQPKIASAAGCFWCRGAPPAGCPRCQATGKVLVTCPVCRGSESAFCLECRGLGRTPCEKCGGTGWKRIKLVDTRNGKESKGGRSSDDWCNGRGTVVCKSCEKQRVACWFQNPSEGLEHRGGKVTISCAFCDGDGKLECSGCYRGTSRAFEVAAGVLCDAKSFPLAADLYRDAILKASAFYDSKKPEGDVTPEQIAKRREATLSRLESGLKRALAGAK